MKRGRHQTQLFVTVLSACLGLMAAAVPAEAHKAASTVLYEISATACATHAYAHSSNQTLRLTAICNAHPLPFALRSVEEPSKVLYSNTKALTSNQILVITHLPRASLDAATA